jgi:hypothetical protein
MKLFKSLLRIVCPHVRRGIQFWAHPFLEAHLPEGWYSFCVHCDKRLDFLTGDRGIEGQLSAIKMIGGNVSGAVLPPSTRGGWIEK